MQDCTNANNTYSILINFMICGNTTWTVNLGEGVRLGKVSCAETTINSSKKKK